MRATATPMTRRTPPVAVCASRGRGFMRRCRREPQHQAKRERLASLLGESRAYRGLSEPAAMKGGEQ